MKSKVGIILAAVAAYGIYKYSQMSAEEKEALKNKGRDFLEKNLGELTGLFGKKTSMEGNS